MTSVTSPVMSERTRTIHDHNIRQPHPRLSYPHVLTLQRPPASYNGHSRRQSQNPRMDRRRMSDSVSSAASGSSGRSTTQRTASQQSYWHAPNMEQGLMTEKHMQSRDGPRVNEPAYLSSRQDVAENNSVVLQYVQQRQKLADDDDDDDEADDHAFWLLFWLACLDPIHSFVSAIYTILVLFALILASPIRICQKQSSFGDQIVRVLAPIFRHHLDMLKAPSVENAFSFEFKPTCLVIIHLTSPFLSMGVMLASWVSAAFWLFALALGNPDGTEKSDDGRDAVISVRNWWERYLLNAIRR